MTLSNIQIQWLDYMHTHTAAKIIYCGHCMLVKAEDIHLVMSQIAMDCPGISQASGYGHPHPYIIAP